MTEVYFGLKSSFARVCEVRRLGEIAGQLNSPIIIGRLIIIIIIVLYINRRMSLISSWLSTKTFAIVDISDYRRYTILSSIGTTLVCGLYVCVNEVQVWIINQSQVWGMMRTGVRMEMVNIQGMAPSSGAKEAVREPPLYSLSKKVRCVQHVTLTASILKNI